jgi:hypothetical protein
MGWPLVVSAWIMPATEDVGNTSAVTIAPPSGNWADALKFVLTGSDGNGRALQLQPSMQLTESRFDLSANEVIQMEWLLSPDLTAALDPGQYSLTVALDLANANEGWAGLLNAEPLTIHVLSERQDLTAGDAQAAKRSKTLSMARYFMLLGDTSRASAQLDSILTDDPDDYDALVYRALVYEQDDDLKNADVVVQHAIKVWSAAGTGPLVEAPVAMFELQRRIRNQLLQQ